MELWSRKRIGISEEIQLVKGWNDVDDAKMGRMSAGQKKYFEACVKEELISDKASTATGPAPSENAPPEGPNPILRQLKTAMAHCSNLEELEALGEEVQEAFEAQHQAMEAAEEEAEADDEPMLAKDLIAAIKSCDDLEKLESLDASEDERVTVKEAYADKLEELTAA